MPPAVHRLAMQAVALIAFAGARPVSGQSWTAIRLHDPAEAGSSEAFAGYGTSQGGNRRPPGSLAVPGLWESSSASWRSLAPAGANGGWVNAMSADSQVGELGINGVGFGAALWRGTTESFIQLHPAGAYASEALSLTGQRQGGYVIAVPGGFPHATIWSGSAASAIDLNPPSAGPYGSTVRAMDGELQAGFARLGPFNAYHAALWHGTAQSFVDLNPSWSIDSQVFGMKGGQQVGYAQATNLQVATLWTGTAESAAVLDPFGFGGSRLYATDGEYQVGYAQIPGAGSFPHAGLWHGSATSFFDLSQSLPPGYFYSEAHSVQRVGDMLYVAGSAVSGASGNGEAWLWIGQVPAPAPGGVLLAGVAWASRRRRPRAA